MGASEVECLRRNPPVIQGKIQVEIKEVTEADMQWAAPASNEEDEHPPVGRRGAPRGNPDKYLRQLSIGRLDVGHQILHLLLAKIIE